MIVLHGVLGSSRNWQTAGRELSQRYHVLALDLRNHGMSAHDASMGFADMAADVLAWMDAHGLPAATLVGHSMGGKVAMLLACRHPERVSRLVVVDVAPKDYQWRGQRTAFAAMRDVDLARVGSRADTEQALAARIHDLSMRKFLATNLEAAPGGGWRWIVNLGALEAALDDLEKDSLGPGDRYDGPCLFVTGEKSPYVDPADWPGILARFPAAVHVRIPGAGHNPHMDNRGAFVGALLS
jgi:esterase